MKKLILVFTILISQISVLALDDLKDVGIAKYAVLEVLEDFTPLRASDSENAYRISHLYKDTVLFADKQNDDYYRVELRDNDYVFVNKKFVEVQAIIPEKRFESVEKITFRDEKNKISAKIETKTQSAYSFQEDETNLDFTLYDNNFNPRTIKITNQMGAFTFNNEIASELNIRYRNDAPLFGYGILKDESGYILTIRKTPKINKRKPLKNIVVVVDPGHGGVERGACAYGLEEKTINLEISKILKRELEKRGAKVYLTRKKDIQVNLYDRVNFAKEKDADILLSIHQNSLANPKDIIIKHGVGTYYYQAQSAPLAAKIQENLVEATDFKDDKVNLASFALTRPTEQLSVLIECGYIIRKEEAEKISDKKFQKIIAKAIVKGCEEYLVESFGQIK